MNYDQLSIQKHTQYKWKLSVQSKVPLENKEDLSIYYTPGVAAPCLEIQKNPKKAYDYTRINNSVAVISDGSAVLWLGNIGGLAGLPVMEGKAILFKKFGNVDAIPIVLKTQDPDKIINIIENIAPTFGGINLEDIKAPQCFYIESELKKRLKIPVFHDDQHGTAIVTLAGLINSLKLANKKIENIKVVMSWAGSAGLAIAKLLIKAGLQNIIIFDSKGSLHSKRKDLNQYKQELVPHNINDEQSTLSETLKWADVFIWVSQPNIINKDDVANMAQKPIIFAMSNPNPEINPEEAKKGWAYIIATGRSDYPNQLNNVLAFPGIFRGALDAKLEQITDEHKILAAKALANFTQNPTPEKIIPSPLEEWVADAVAEAIKK